MDKRYCVLPSEKLGSNAWYGARCRARSGPCGPSVLISIQQVLKLRSASVDEREISGGWFSNETSTPACRVRYLVE
jgi:hypothetical protein